MQLGEHLASSACACIFVDEAQFLSKEQVWELARFVDDYNVPVMCYGLRCAAWLQRAPKRRLALPPPPLTPQNV